MHTSGFNQSSEAELNSGVRISYIRENSKIIKKIIQKQEQAEKPTVVNTRSMNQALFYHPFRDQIHQSQRSQQRRSHNENNYEDESADCSPPCIIV